MSHYFVGIRSRDSLREIFASEFMPCPESHGHLYVAAIGPFRTKQGAEYMVRNPLCQTVTEAERRARN